MSQKTHFEPYYEDYECYDSYMCGSNVNQDDGMKSTSCWAEVTCKGCLRSKISINKWVEETEKHILKDMESFVEFNEKKEAKDAR